jgi:tellurite resistance protein TerC
MFAVDSVPAVLAVSQDPFVVYSSNIFAILGLRALYFVLARALQSLRLLRPALALILVLVGAKMLISDVYEVSTALSLVVVGTILTAATLGSLLLAEPLDDTTDE